MKLKKDTTILFSEVGGCCDQEEERKKVRKFKAL